MVSPLATAILALAPQVYLELGEPNGPTAFDSSGNARNGVFTGVPYFGIDGVPGSEKTGIQFYPQSVPAPHNVSVPAGFGDFASFTAMLYARMYVIPPPVSAECLMACDPDATHGWNLNLGAGITGPTFQVRTAAGGSNSIQCSASLASLVRQWVQIGCQYDAAGPTITVFINGRVAATAAAPGARNVSASAGRIGDQGPRAPDFAPYTSDAAQFAIWNSALTLPQMHALYVAAGTTVLTGAPGENTSAILAEILAAVKKKY